MSERSSGRWDPEAVEALAEQAVVEARAAKDRQDDAESFIREIKAGLKANSEAFDEFRRGTTAWQTDVTRKQAEHTAQLVVLTNHVLALTSARFAWPSMIAVGALLLGGFGAVLVWMIATH